MALTVTGRMQLYWSEKTYTAIELHSLVQIQQYQQTKSQQPMQIVSAIPTTPIVTTVPQSQVQTVVSQLVQTGPSTLQPQVSGQEAQVS